MKIEFFWFFGALIVEFLKIGFKIWFNCSNSIKNES